MRTEPIKKAELLELLTAARDTSQGYIDASDGSDNPQVIDMNNRAQGRADAFDAVIRALTHRERYGLRVFAKGHIGVSGD